MKLYERTLNTLSIVQYTKVHDGVSWRQCRKDAVVLYKITMIASYDMVLYKVILIASYDMVLYKVIMIASYDLVLYKIGMIASYDMVVLYKISMIASGVARAP